MVQHTIKYIHTHTVSVAKESSLKVLNVLLLSDAFFMKGGNLSHILVPILIITF
jgi:hypothetical protein